VQIPEPDYITFAGRGEPTLAANLGEIIKGIKEITDIPVAVLSNSSLIYDPKVQEDLLEADFVILKLDAYAQDSFQTMNRAHPSLNLEKIIQGIIHFRNRYKGKLGIQIMFTNLNMEEVEEIAEIVRKIKPDQIQLNTPLRPRVSEITGGEVRELTPEEMQEIKAIFQRICPEVEIVMVYEGRGKVNSLSKEVTPKEERSRDED
jgi:wyosine [tRNA(Phe)-imidazoG37] synthetase (radical SAM superfamily)